MLDEYPPEIIATVLTYLDGYTLTLCKRVSHHLAGIIANDSRLRYIIQLYATGMRDNSQCAVPVNAKLRALQRLAEQRYPSGLSETRYPGPSVVDGASGHGQPAMPAPSLLMPGARQWRSAQGLLVCNMSERDFTCHNLVNGNEWEISLEDLGEESEDPEWDLLEFEIVPEGSLLLTLEGMTLQNELWDLRIYRRSLLTGGAHPKAGSPYLSLTEGLGMEGLMDRALSFVHEGNLTAVLNQITDENTFVGKIPVNTQVQVHDWRGGVLATTSGTYVAMTFVTERYLLLCGLGGDPPHLILSLIDLEQAPEEGREASPIVSLEYPPFSITQSKERDLECDIRTGIRRISTKDQETTPFYPNWTDSIVVLKVQSESLAELHDVQTFISVFRVSELFSKISPSSKGGQHHEHEHVRVPWGSWRQTILKGFEYDQRLEIYAARIYIPAENATHVVDFERRRAWADPGAFEGSTSSEGFGELWIGNPFDEACVPPPPPYACYTIPVPGLNFLSPVTVDDRFLVAPKEQVQVDFDEEGRTLQVFDLRIQPE